jgi:hypothetical protein
VGGWGRPSGKNIAALTLARSLRDLRLPQRSAASYWGIRYRNSVYCWN